MSEDYTQPSQTHKPIEDEQDPKEEKRFRSRTISRKQMAREHKKLRSRGELLNVVNSWHPKMRSDCVNTPRPCLFVSCRHHLYLDVNPETGSIKYNFPDKEVWELEETCALDIAERGGVTLEEIGRIMNLTRERIRQLEIRGLEKLKALSQQRDDLNSYVDWDPENNEG